KGWQLRGRPLITLREAVFAERPPEGLTLDETLSQDLLPVLAVSDRGTAGLGGPTRADVVTEEQRNDFVEFFRNVGAEPDREFGGGTYGYGKSVLYLMSSAHTILAYTRCLDRGRPVSRLMAAALGRAFRRRVRGRPAPFTGRHWWGVLDRAVGADPLTGAAADGLAHRLGLPGFADGELGTTILIIGAVLGDEPKAAIQAMAEAVLWHCWPKMTASPEREPGIRFSLGWEDEDIPVPDPDGHPELREFARALRVTRADDDRGSGGIDLRPIECLRPRQRLGRLALVQ